MAMYWRDASHNTLAYCIAGVHLRLHQLATKSTYFSTVLKGQPTLSTIHSLHSLLADSTFSRILVDMNEGGM